MFRNESRGGARSGPLVITAAALVAAMVAGWFAYGALHGSDPDHDPVAHAAGGPAAAASHQGSSVADGDTSGTAAPSANSSAGSAGSPSTGTAAGTGPLAGKVVVLDPGHNLGNAQHIAEMNRLVDIGTNRKACDTTGTETDAGYPEASYTLDVSHRVRALLEARGARVTLTYDGDRPYGPCVDERARIGNAAHADAALSIHADGAPAADYGFHVIAPKSVHAGAADTRAIAGPSRVLATTLRSHFKAATGEPFADYLAGGTGMTVRDDLGGLNLSTVPKVFIECGNMRNARDAGELTDPRWRQRAAEGIADGLTAFLEGKR